MNLAALPSPPPEQISVKSTSKYKYFYSFKTLYWKILSRKWQPFCSRWCFTMLGESLKWIFAASLFLWLQVIILIIVKNLCQKSADVSASQMRSRLLIFNTKVITASSKLTHIHKITTLEKFICGAHQLQWNCGTGHPLGLTGLTHFSQVMHIQVSNIISSDNGLLPNQCEAITTTNAGLWLL